MTVKLLLSFNCRGLTWLATQRLFAAAGCADLLTHEPLPLGYCSVRIDGHDPRLSGLLARLEEKRITVSMKRDHVHTLEELMHAPLVWLCVTRAAVDDGGPMRGTQYDMSSACARCGTGATQASPLVIRSGKLPKANGAHVCSTMDDDILVSRKLADTLQRHGVSGLNLREVLSTLKREPLGWWQILPDYEMPPLAPETRGIVREDPCPACDRDGYFHAGDIPVEMAYRKREVDIDHLPDCVRTYERFGNSRLKTPFAESHLAAPLLLFKPVVCEIFNAMGIKGVRFVPVKVCQGEPLKASFGSWRKARPLAT